MTLTVIQDPLLLAWANSRLGTKFEPSRCRWVAGFDEHGVIFVCVYSRFSERSCELTLASDGTRRWATKRSLRLIAAQPFRTWGLARVDFTICALNQKSIEIATRIGAVYEGRLRRWFGEGEGNDGIVFGILAEEAQQWVEMTHHRRPRRHQIQA